MSKRRLRSPCVEWPLRHSGRHAARDEEFEELVKVSPRSIGGDGFRDWVDSLHFELFSKRKRAEDVSFRRELRLIPTDRILGSGTACIRLCRVP